MTFSFCFDSTFRSADLSLLFLSAAVFEEMKPKFVKGTKRYGRRSRPDSEACEVLTCDSEDSPPSKNEAADSSPPGVRRAKQRRSTSLESVEVSILRGWLFLLSQVVDCQVM